MIRRTTLRQILPALPLLALQLACGQEQGPPPGPMGTPALREALFDSILARTARRAAFSPPKEEALEFDPLSAMEALRGDVVGADTEDALFYALVRLSNARRDRHLSVGLVDLGIRPEFTDGLEVWGGSDPPDPREAGVRFLPDFGSDQAGYFVSDVAVGEGAPGSVAAGDRVVSLNGLSAAQLESTLGPYIRSSTPAGFRWKLAQALSLRSAILPPEFLRDSLSLEVRKPDGSMVSETLPYHDQEGLEWSLASEPSYPGFAMEWSTPTYDLYLPESEGLRAVLLQWHRFESSSLIQDVDRLVEFAAQEDLLDQAVIFDATRSGGGSLGAYAVQRLQPKPFKTTFGTLRLSDVIEPFVQEKREEFAAREVNDGGGPETLDDGAWLMDWLEVEVLDGLARGDSVTDPVPFKLAHAPKDSDGILQPAPVHFRGPLVVYSGPNGGSHLDQFMSIVADNDLGFILGMPDGGYSNTWEWEEVLHYPGTYQPVVGFMWSIGHTIRPNGEILEGNPAPVDLPVPLTADNAQEYYQILLARTWDHLAQIGFDVGRR